MDTSLIGIPSLIRYNAAPKSAPPPVEEKKAAAPQDTVSTSTASAASPQKKRWTFLFYVNGNNFLSKQAPAQLRMLEMTGGSDDNINIVAQVARMKGGLDGITKDWIGVRRYEVPATGKELDQGEMQSEILRELIPPYTRGITSTLKDDLGDADMGDAATLKDFVQWGMNNYPAEHYCVVMLGPSQGMKGVMRDETTGHQMSPDDLKTALDGVKKATGQEVDVLAFDSSNSTQAEMLYALKDSTKYVVGSEGLVSGTGMSTPSVMFELKKANTDKTRTPEEVAQTFSMVGSMAVSQAQFTPTVSAVDMSKVGAIRDAVNDLGEALVKSSIDRNHLRDLVANTQEVAMPGVTRAYEGVKDAYHFAKLVARDKDITDASVKSAAQKVMDAVDGALVGEAHRGGPYRNANGISVFLPENYGFIRPDTYPVDKSFDHKFNYESLAFSQGNAWPKFLAEIGKDDFAGRLGAKVLGQGGVDKVVGFQRQWSPTVASLGSLASNVGWYESYDVLSSGRPGKLLFLPGDTAATIGMVGGAFDVYNGVKAGVQAWKDERSYDVFVMNGLDVVGGVAKSVACAALVHPGAVPFAFAAGMFGFVKPWLKDAYGYFMQYKQIRDSIALADPAAGQKSAVMAAHVMLNKDKVWDK
jgi:hypothetical protein